MRLIRKPQTASARDDVATAAAGALVAAGDGTGYFGGAELIPKCGGLMSEQTKVQQTETCRSLTDLVAGGCTAANTPTSPTGSGRPSVT